MRHTQTHSRHQRSQAAQPMLSHGQVLAIFISSNKAADWYMAAAAGGRPCYMRGKNCGKERAKAGRYPEGAEPSG